MALLLNSSGGEVEAFRRGARWGDQRWLSRQADAFEVAAYGGRLGGRCDDAHAPPHAVRRRTRLHAATATSSDKRDRRTVAPSVGVARRSTYRPGSTTTHPAQQAIPRRGLSVFPSSPPPAKTRTYKGS